MPSRHWSLWAHRYGVPANGITFCQGTITEMGVDVLEEIRYFGKLGRINLVHFRAVRGAVTSYTEVFIDEGDIDILEAIRGSE
jgi:mannonate dehydratase